MLLKEEMPTYTTSEERWNFYTHLIGFIMCVIGTILLLIKAVKIGNAWKTGAVTIYASTMLILYLLSTIYHTTSDPKKRKIMQKCDHASISILIAGCGTAVLMGAIQSQLAYVLTGVIWFISITAMIFNIINVRKFRALTMTSYILSGILPLLLIFQIIQILGIGGFALMLSGGIIYLTGLTFYAIHKEYLHTIWHFFVLVGSVLHFCMVYFYVLVK